MVRFVTGMLRYYEKLVIVNERTTGNSKEMKLMSCFNTLGEAIHKAAGLTEFATRETCRALRGSERTAAGERLDWELQYTWTQQSKHTFHDQKRKAILYEESLRGVYHEYAMPSRNVEAMSERSTIVQNNDWLEKTKLYDHILSANLEQAWMMGKSL